MFYKVQYRCLSNDCKIVIEGSKDELLDGIRCCVCDSPVISEPYNPKDKHMIYRRESKVDQSLDKIELLLKNQEQLLANQVEIINKIDSLLSLEKKMLMEYPTGGVYNLKDQRTVGEC